MVTEVTDPDILRQLEGDSLPAGLQQVTDPDILRQLEGPQTSPLAPPVQEGLTIPTEQGGALVLDLPEPTSAITIKAAESGIQFDTPASSGHFLASLAIDEKERLKAYKQSLGRDFGQDIEVRMGPDTGQIEYLDPQTNRFSLALPPGSDEGIESLGGLGIVLSAELALGTATALSGFGTPATIGAGAFGAYLGEVARLSYGQSLGINQDMTINDALAQAEKEAGISALGGTAGVGLSAVGRFIFDAIQGRVISREVAESARLSVEQADALATRINAELGENRMKFTLAQATNDEDLLATQSLLERSPEYRREFGAFEDEQRAALRAFRDRINRPYQTRAPIEQTEDRVRGIAQANVDRDVVPQNVFVESAEAKLDDMISSLRTRPPEDLGRTVRPFGDAEQTSFTTAAGEAADALDAVAGRAAFITNKRSFDAVNKLKGENKRLLLTSLARTSKQLLGQAETVDGPLTAAGKLGLPLPDDPKALEEAIEFLSRPGSKLFDKNAKFTFKEAWGTVSALKRLERIAGKGLSTDEPAVGQIKLIRSSLEKDMREGMQGSAVREEYDQFTNWYRAEKTRLDRGTVGDIMQQSEGRFIISDDTVFRSVFVPNDARPSKEFKALIENNPDQMTAMRESILGQYKNEVIKEGRVNIRAHNQFMTQHEGSMKEFFKKSEIDTLRKTKNADLVLQAREVNRKRTLDRINKGFDQQLSDLKPGKLASIAMDRGNPQNAWKLMRMLGTTPDVARAVRAEVRKDIAERTAGQTINGERVLNAIKLNDFLNGKSGEKGYSTVLKATMGEQYVNNLNILNDALQVAARETKFPNRSNTAFWSRTIMRLGRAYWGMFTPRARLATAGRDVGEQAANRVLVRAMLNPDNLEELMKVRGMDLRSKKAAAVISALGGSALLEDYNQ